MNTHMSASDSRCDLYFFPLIKLFMLFSLAFPKILFLLCLSTAVNYCFLAFAALPDEYWDSWTFCWDILVWIWNLLKGFYSDWKEEEAFRTEELKINRHEFLHLRVFKNSFVFQAFRFLTAVLFFLSFVFYDFSIWISFSFLSISILLFFFTVLPVYREIYRLPIKKKTVYHFPCTFNS
jgi:hypothetical protein